MGLYVIWTMNINIKLVLWLISTKNREEEHEQVQEHRSAKAKLGETKAHEIGVSKDQNTLPAIYVMQ